jgi:hypothetical protein
MLTLQWYPAMGPHFEPPAGTIPDDPRRGGSHRTLLSRSNGNVVLNNSRQRKRRKTTLHSFLVEAKVTAVEIATTIVFLVWLYREVVLTIAK